MNGHSFIVRFLIVFIPLMIFMFIMSIAGITDDLLMTIILSLAFVWMVQAIYKAVMRKKQDK